MNKTAATLTEVRLTLAARDRRLLHLTTVTKLTLI